MVKRIVVTGAAGMLGAHLVRRLASEGWSVTGVDVRPTEEPDGSVLHIVADVRDRAAMSAAVAGADAVVHCAAALPSYPAEQIRSIIVEGTRTVLGQAAAAGVERLVYISSTAVYGLPTVVPTPEEYPRSPMDEYSRAKAAAEVVAEQFRSAGSCVSILRPKTFLGPGRMGLFSMLFEWAEEGRNFPVLGRGDVRIQMLAVDDLIDGVLAALHAPEKEANDTYNLAAAEFRTIRDDFQSVLDAAGHGRRVVSLPARPALLTLRLLELSRLSPVYGRLLHKLMADSYVSVDKASAKLGFNPKFSNRDAILRTYDWWQENRMLQGPGNQARSGRTSRDPWRQGALSAARVFF
ncbi:NAD-dependent epimerase/dehydratase family protein [Streptomyces sp. ADMS]|uniref:NAD-dependent epimerase/dehydratase family protein n=1 Tax=Streptomyces sp. ADMS TaxID=3071415 RepID=UPI00296FF902|nr:NAD-dependent epimerase/dehydratase family protein [Streptomyces sp. ADMS]MDW4910795.1 NAD-dependent epimerase/dehydratase family protein [Streptomyces sp. ADMS]